MNINANLLPISLAVVRVVMPISLFFTITVSLQKLIVTLCYLFNVEYANLFLQDPFKSSEEDNNSNIN